jgi:hypothetical protein
LFPESQAVTVMHPGTAVAIHDLDDRPIACGFGRRAGTALGADKAHLSRSYMRNKRNIRNAHVIGNNFFIASYACYACYASSGHRQRWNVPFPRIMEISTTISALRTARQDGGLDLVLPQAKRKPPVIQRPSLHIIPRRLLEVMKRR